ncbi:MAG: TOBE domain-containing protein, partial [Alphaproteobacteria bacterium]|nr:TOBE domain-containing protein [Alphaproteobacteria bacterium]
GAANINCRVDAVEHLGAETILELSAEGLSLTAKMARNNALHHGEKVCVHAAPEKILAFDSHSGNRLRS